MSTASVSIPGQPPSWRRVFSTGTCVRLAIIVVLLAVVYSGIIKNILVARWIRDGNWSHGWLIPVFSLYFLGTRREQLLRVKLSPSYVGALILALSLTMYFVSGWVYRMAYPQAVSIVGSIFGVVLLLGGWRLIKIAWFPILFLMLAIPLPQRVYFALTQPLREIASTVAASVMPFFAAGLHTEAQSVVIDYVLPGSPPGRLNVEEACSGMRSMMAFVTLGVAMAYLGDRATWQRVILVSACVPIAVLCNAVRVTATGLMFVHGREDLARGTPHQMLGILMFGIALALFSLMGYLLNHLFVEESSEPAAVQP